MVNFRSWLNENETSQFDHFKDIILNYLNLDPNKGLSQSLDGFNRQNLKARLQGLREFSTLPVVTQQKILAMIDGAQGGTVGDLIRQMTGMPQQVKYNPSQDVEWFTTSSEGTIIPFEFQNRKIEGLQWHAPKRPKSANLISLQRL